MGILQRALDGARQFRKTLFPLGGIGLWTAGRPEASPYNPTQLKKAYRENVWVNACVRRIADVIAGLPVKLYRETTRAGKVTREEITTGQLYDRLWNPHPFYSLTKFKRKLVSDFVLLGEAYIFAEDGQRGSGDKVAADPFWRPLSPDHLKPIPDPFDLVSGYVYERNGRQFNIRPHFIRSLMTYNPDSDYHGLPPSQVAADPVMLRKLMMEYNQLWFDNGGTNGLAILTERSIKEDVLKRLRAQFEEAYGARSQKHKAMFFTHGLTPQNLSTSAKDGEFINLWKMAREEVQAVYGVPPVLTGIFEYANYANARQQIEIFIDYTIVPIIQFVEDVLNNELIPLWYPKEYAGGVFVEHDLSRVRAKLKDIVAETTRDQINVNTGLRTVNELRSRDNLPSVSWGNNPPLSFGGGLALPLSSRDMGSAKDENGDRAVRTVIDGSRPVDVKSWLDIREDLGSYAPGAEFKGTDDELIEAHWKAFDRRLARDENRFASVVRDFFRDQEARVIDNFMTLYSRSARKSGGVDWIRNSKVSPDDLFAVFNLEAETEATQIAFRPILKAIAESVGVIAMQPFNRFTDNDLIFNVHDARLEAFIEGKLLKFANDITPTTKEIIRSILADGFHEDLTVQQVATSIRNRFDGFRKTRSIVIARTEMLGTHNGVTLEAYRQSGVVERKIWVTSRDSRVRDSHRALEGKVVELDGEFASEIGGTLRAPGLGGSVSLPADIVNCRCTVRPQVRRAAS